MGRSNWLIAKKKKKKKKQGRHNKKKKKKKKKKKYSLSLFGEGKCVGFCVPNVFSWTFQHVLEVPNVFLNMLPIAPHIIP